MRMLVRTLAVCGLIVWANIADAQGSAAPPQKFKADIKRQLFHDYVDREQKAALAADGKADALLAASADDEINYLVTEALTTTTDRLQQQIEQDSAFTHTQKVAYIRGLEVLLKRFNTGYRSRRFLPSHMPEAILLYENAIAASRKNESIEGLVRSAAYPVGDLVVGSGAFDQNKGFYAAKLELLRKYVHLHPQRSFEMLKDNVEVPFRDSLILAAGRRYPRLLYDYAAANNKLGYAIRKIDDPLVQTVSKMATSGGSGQIYFAFLDNLLKGRMTLAEIDAVKADDVKFYRLLVQTRLDYIQRMQKKEEVLELAALTAMLEKRAKDVFIKTINALHNESDGVRFRILHQLTPQELYYLIVSGENEIYTSSYTRGVFPIMMQKIGNRGDSLLMSVKFDRFRKFIKIAAGFNTLNPFLKTLSGPEQSKALMAAFVNNLERSGGLEDGVDVADSYVSISEGNPELARYVLDLSKHNYDKNLSANNRRGMVMYNLLYKLFLSADTTSNINLSEEFGIPPVYNVSYGSLADSNNRVVMQVFFYGDEDGMNIYQGFLRQYNNANWKTTYSDKWVQITSTKGKPILIFANKPLPEETGKDEEAQAELTQFLSEKGMEPSIVIHRGHSYYANSTIEHIQPSAKIVFMGSCGGYHLIHDVLKHSPDAHIIASKQIGRTVINQPFFNLLTEKMRNGNNIDWIPFWNEFKRTAGGAEGFEDYIPPHKNLGAIFIKAYRTSMGEEEE
ncbi:hypothetical protein [Paracnuella aquatica]|uniref:hypothetical protein n=1 Tax=Paracnuella aquatica TaxID=2268757 RepID=UPI000DF00419|nr:hypothetical protein [Paracnuella aquatica]RPD48212.1 hypothetical protein DRJ53_10720 [Paracnuella aquatica]